MSNRLEILKASLEKKENAFDACLGNHFNDVKSANGQPLNDKRNGHTTLNRWEKQNQSLKNHSESIKKTKMAIEREEDKIALCGETIAKIPNCIVLLVNNGTLVQWRKFPNTFFVAGVEKGRIGFDFKKNVVFHRYYLEIPTAGQKEKFKEIYNELNKKINIQPTPTKD
jgi:hypothetical protein